MYNGASIPKVTCTFAVL